MKETDKTALFNRLKPILHAHEAQLVVAQDQETEYQLETAHVMKNKKRLYFGGVKVNKNYVSFHLMPLYVNPDLLKLVSPNLKKRMQGKSCFNFKQLDETLFEELEQLTQAVLEDYKKQGYL